MSTGRSLRTPMVCEVNEQSTFVVMVAALSRKVPSSLLTWLADMNRCEARSSPHREHQRDCSSGLGVVTAATSECA